ncbi:hypothetical protein D9758_015184 [Tetrapyrgos nigripes]|uniref:Uncharacterized protein n=1 Tax=Tetrapyrgos nigripes TaxID=182062 RepID=A0A8H5C0Q1_9AGAR|nr:hypothetical protein D9758_015184 [Tetrapyrgos nigripes]
MPPRESLQLQLDDVVDAQGRATIPEINVATDYRDKDRNVTPWESSSTTPPSPPPKGPRTFAQKLSLSSLRQGSQASLTYLRQGSQTTLVNYSSRSSESHSIYSDETHFNMVPHPVPDDPLLSPDTSPKREIRKAKSSLNLIPKSSMFSISKKRSKSHLRPDSDDAEHPSLLPIPPPLPDYKSFLPLKPASPLILLCSEN